MANRRLVHGFETGATGEFAPSDSNIFVQSDIVRTGAFALKVEAQSGVNSSLRLDFAAGHRRFFRGYLRLGSLPTQRRSLLRWMSASHSDGYGTLLLEPDGRLSLGSRAGGSSILIEGTGTTALETDRWYCVEVGYGCSLSAGTSGINLMALRLDGQTEVDWLPITGGNGPHHGFDQVYIGALDTVNASFTAYWDDIAVDAASWCEPGEVRRLLLSSVTIDTGGYTLFGSAADKVEALNTLSDESGVNSPNNATDTLAFSLQDPPAHVTHVRGMNVWKRMRRTATSSSHYSSTYRRIGTHGQVHDTVYTGSTSFRWHPATRSDTPLQANQPLDQITALEAGIRASSSGSVTGQISQLVVEIDCDTRSNQQDHPRRQLIAGFNHGGTTPLASTTSGASASTHRARTGPYGFRVQSSGTTSEHGQINPPSDSGFTETTHFWRFYVWFDTLPPAGGSHAIWYRGSTLSSLHRRARLDVNGQGQLRVWDADGSFAWVNAGLQTGQWYRIEIMTRLMSASGANDGRMVVRVDGETVIDQGGLNAGTGQSSVWIGTFSKSGSMTTDVSFDDIALDSASWPGETRIIDLVPTGPGAVTGNNDWDSAPVSGLPRWSMLNETPFDDATTYVITSPSSSNSETYAIEQLPANATKIVCTHQVIRHRRPENQSSAGTKPGLRTRGFPSDINASTTTSTNWSTFADFRRTSHWFGWWTRELIHSSELELQTWSSGSRAEVTNVRLSVEYIEGAVTEEREIEADGYVVGQVRLRQLQADAIVIEPQVGNARTRDLRATGLVIPGEPPIAFPDKFYLSNAAPGYTIAFQHGDWDVTRSLRTRQLATVPKGARTFRTSTKFPPYTEESHCLLQFISEPLLAQVVQGALRLVFAPFETSHLVDAYTRIHVWISQGSSAQVRGVLLDNYVGSLEWGTSAIGRALDIRTNITPVTIQTGDRLIVELGFVSLSTTSGSGVIWYGGRGGDLVEGEPYYTGVPYLSVEGATPVDEEEPTVTEEAADLGTDAVILAPGIVSVETDAHVVREEQRALESDALVQQSSVSDLPGDGLVRASLISEIVAGGLVRVTENPEIVADSVVQATGQLDLITDGPVQVSSVSELSADGALRMTDELDLSTSAVVTAEYESTLDAGALVLATSTRDLPGHGLVQSTDHQELATDAWVVYLGRRDLATDALVRDTRDPDQPVTPVAGGIPTPAVIIDAITAHSAVI